MFPGGAVDPSDFGSILRNMGIETEPLPVEAICVSVRLRIRVVYPVPFDPGLRVTVIDLCES